ncbi:MAG: hypothetical protein WD357_08490 [Gracilimonas sp.]
MKQFLFTILISLFLTITIFAQVIDDSDLKKLESGQYKIEQGMIQVSFSDTLSNNYMERKLSEYGYKILSSNFKNILLSIDGEPVREQLEEIKTNRWVEFIIGETTNITEEDIKRISEMNSLDKETMDKLYTQLEQNTNPDPVFISMSYNTTSSQANELISSYPDLGLRIIRGNQRSAVIKTEPGKEAETMEALEHISFVNSTAHIGVID